MSKVHERVVELVFVADDSAETVAVSAVNYYRDGSSSAFPITFTQTSQLTGGELVLGELLPPPTRIRLTFTVQA